MLHEEKDKDGGKFYCCRYRRFQAVSSEKRGYSLLIALPLSLLFYIHIILLYTITGEQKTGKRRDKIERGLQSTLFV